MRALGAASLALLLPALAAAIDPLEPLKRVAVPKPLFVSACQRVYREARDDVRKHPGTVVPLTPAQREHLDKFFGAARVSRIRYHFGATTPRITILGFAIIDRPSAITFGDDVYLKNAARPDSDGQLALLAHEATHVGQYEKPNFSSRYCGALYDADFRYARNKFEKEAFSVQKAFSDYLREVRGGDAPAEKPTGTASK